MVQDILSDMNSDEVNSISDTVESLQVANIVRESYEYLVATLRIPERQSLVHLEGLADVDRPNYLRIPDTVKDIQWIKYNGADVDYLVPEDFINYTLMNPGTLSVSDFGGVSYTIVTDRDPKYWTCFDDQYLVFDAFNSSDEATLQESKSMSFVDLDRTFRLEDDFICDLDANLFPLLFNEAKSVSFIDLKEVSNSGAEARSRRSLVRAQNELSKTSRPKAADRLPNYGRRR
jgi:hypothetical protein